MSDPTDIPVTPEEEEAWRDLEKKQPPVEPTK